MLSRGRCDPRADRLLLRLQGVLQESCQSAETSTTQATVIPWGLAHMTYIERGLLDMGLKEIDADARHHLTCTWPAFIWLTLTVWLWWWFMHAAADTWVVWRTERRIAINMPLYWLWGATLHIGPSVGKGTKDQHLPTGMESLVPPEGALQRFWGRSN